ncbi:1-hydroxycarotenoid 3,4-desaturase CrtD [Roseibaca sp. Y0-43]|uniref:1-hydroxycarotenoid 3,4-desaturase CrtD n=1 Tax=Roseibaca sp. Y0-43 TaxID=2816854 RepID=UPI001D0CCE79|nr:1-hydroxycarotenoid 3,4-desaturase CrtD [Roseibaca sp. Y0-43]MCC1481479.1 phytoene desaturase [Roseibaca sp. Y0-43]
MGHCKDSIAIIGAGMGGLAAGIRLAAAGRDVTIYEAHGWPGGKMRTVASQAGPVDAGPTVLTLRDVLDDLFATAGTTTSDQITLKPLNTLARHYWSDGTKLDLTHDAGQNSAAIATAFGPRAARDFERFSAETRALYQAFDAPIMRAPRPSVLASARAALAQPQILPWLVPGRSLDAMLRKRLSDPRLRQLFGRYATYVGGNPLLAPAVLGLVWQAEAAGVWAVQGGMARLAHCLAALFERLGGSLRLNTPVARILTHKGRVTGLHLANGDRASCTQVIFNGDPAALPYLLDVPQRAPKARQTQPRSLSARVWTFAAEVSDDGIGRDALAYHTLFFADDPAQEFTPLAHGRTPPDPTIYVCAQDRATGRAPVGPERFQFILNAPATRPGALKSEPSCNTHPFERLARFGLHLTPRPTADSLTTPARFAMLFPHSQGALYGLSPNGAMATFQRPTARTKVAGLYLAGGGVHPGAGVPMALISGGHAAAAVLSDRISRARSAPMATPGGMSTASAIAAAAPSRSSGS